MSELTFRVLRRLADGRFHSGEEMARDLGRSRATLSEALKHVDDMGIELFSVRGKGYRLAQPLEFLDGDLLSARLADSRVRVQVVDEIDSTSTKLLELAARGAPSGTCLAAEWQSAGRGRRGRGWVSGLGGSLTFSLLWRFERGVGHLGGLSLAIGLSVARTLRAMGVARAQVKWPNDVVCDFRKLAGILVETSGEMQGPSTAVIGVGVNYRLADAVLDRIDQATTDVCRCAVGEVSRTVLLASLLADLAEMLERFEREGFEPLRAAWRELHAYDGRIVRVVPPQDAPYEATVLDVAANGALVVQPLAGGAPQQLSSAEISLRPR
jgi:BirA family transcriptional regulator, biotin operon repressor / biotin---[acetyl-CoA-carboxylase] ligase